MHGIRDYVECILRPLQCEITLRKEQKSDDQRVQEWLLKSYLWDVYAAFRKQNIFRRAYEVHIPPEELMDQGVRSLMLAYGHYKSGCVEFPVYLGCVAVKNARKQICDKRRRESGRSRRSDCAGADTAHVRSRRRRPRIISESELNDDDREFGGLDTFPGKRNELEELVDLEHRQHVQATIGDAVAHLPSRYRTAIVLYDLVDYDSGSFNYKDIGEVIGTTAESVQRRRDAVYAKLRETLRSLIDEDSACEKDLSKLMYRVGRTRDEEMARKSELTNMMRTAIENLTPREQILLVLCGDLKPERRLTFDEIAAALGISQHAVLTRHEQALRYLRRYLIQHTPNVRALIA